MVAIIDESPPDVFEENVDVGFASKQSHCGFLLGQLVIEILELGINFRHRSHAYCRRDDDVQSEEHSPARQAHQSPESVLPV